MQTSPFNHGRIVLFSGHYATEILLLFEMSIVCSLMVLMVFKVPGILGFDGPKDSVYGKRDGYVSGLAIISGQDNRNLLRSSRGWKTGCVHEIEMLGRASMFKATSS